MDNLMVIFNTIALWIIVAGQIAQLVHLKELEKDTHKQAEYNRSFAKSIRRVANLARGDENAGKRC